MVIRRSKPLKLLSGLCDVDEVIDAVGGTAAAARLAGKSPQSITNCRARGTLPPDTFLIFEDALRALGFCAPPELWGITAPAGVITKQSAN